MDEGDGQDFASHREIDRRTPGLPSGVMGFIASAGIKPAPAEAEPCKNTAAIDSGFRRNDGWGVWSDGWGMMVEGSE